MYSKKAIACDLFIFKSNELLGSVGLAIQEKSTTKLFQRNDPLWKEISKVDLKDFKLSNIWTQPTIKTLLLLAVISIASLLIWLGLKRTQPIMESSVNKRYLAMLLFLFYLIVVTPIVLGFQNLALFIAKNMLLTLVLTVVGYNGSALIDWLFKNLSSKDTTFGRKLREYLGVRLNKTVAELSLLRITASAVFLLIIIILYL